MRSGNAIDWKAQFCALVDRSITEVEIPEGVENIGTCALSNCFKLLKVVLPTTTKSIGDQAFFGTGKMKTMVVKAVVPPSLAQNAMTYNIAGIYVPDESVEAYKASDWSIKADKIHPMSELTEY